MNNVYHYYIKITFVKLILGQINLMESKIYHLNYQIIYFMLSHLQCLSAFLSENQWLEWTEGLWLALTLNAVAVAGECGYPSGRWQGVRGGVQRSGYLPQQRQGSWSWSMVNGHG